MLYTDICDIFQNIMVYISQNKIMQKEVIFEQILKNANTSLS